MSAVVDFVDDLVAGIPVINTAWELTKDLYDFVWQNVYAPALEFTFRILGIEDQDIISSQVVNTRLLEDDDDLSAFWTQLALTHQDTQMGIIEILQVRSQQARTSYANYYTYGSDEYYANLPDVQINAMQNKTEDVRLILNSIYGAGCTVLYSVVKLPSKMEYVGYKLQSMYGYKPNTKKLTYSNGFEYYVKTVDYNYSTNQYDIGMYRPATYVIRTDVTVALGTPASPGDPKAVPPIPPTEATPDTVTTTVTWVITVTKELTVVEEVKSTVVTYVPYGTGVASSTTTTDPIAYEYMPIVINLPASVSKQFYVVLFEKAGSSDWFYWLYEIGLGTYPVLDTSVKGITQLEMLPIVEIRNNATNINVDKTTAKYLQTKEILGFVGIDVDTMVASLEESPSIADVQNAYIHFSLDASIPNKYTGRMLFDMFEYVLKDSAISVTTDPTTYTVTFKEGNYNTALTWSYSKYALVTGVACPIGECINSIDIVTEATEFDDVIDPETGEPVPVSTQTINYLVLRKQINATQYEEYRLGNMTNSTFIHRGGLTDMKSVLFGSIKEGTTYNEFLIPLSINFIKKMSALDQIVIFRKSMYMSVYAAQVTHLEYYETPEFFAVVQIIAIVIVIAVTILTAGAGASISSILMQVASKLAIGMVIGIALQWVMEQTDDPYLKAALGIAAGIAMAYASTGDVSTLQTVFISANGLATGVTQYTENQFKNLGEQMSAFSAKAEARLKELEEGFDAFKSGISIEFTAMLATTEAYDPYMKGWEAQRYAMGPMMYNWGLLKGDVISNAFDYDKYYKLGVV